MSSLAPALRVYVPVVGKVIPRSRLLVPPETATVLTVQVAAGDQLVGADGRPVSVVLGLSGRGDKDLSTLLARLT